MPDKLANSGRYVEVPYLQNFFQRNPGGRPGYGGSGGGSSQDMIRRLLESMLSPDNMTRREMHIGDGGQGFREGGFHFYGPKDQVSPQQLQAINALSTLDQQKSQRELENRKLDLEDKKLGVLSEQNMAQLRAAVGNAEAQRIKVVGDSLRYEAGILQQMRSDPNTDEKALALQAARVEQLRKDFDAMRESAGLGDVSRLDKIASGEGGSSSADNAKTININGVLWGPGENGKWGPLEEGASTANNSAQQSQQGRSPVDKVTNPATMGGGPGPGISADEYPTFVQQLLEAGLGAGKDLWRDTIGKPIEHISDLNKLLGKKMAGVPFTKEEQKRWDEIMRGPEVVDPLGANPTRVRNS